MKKILIITMFASSLLSVRSAMAWHTRQNLPKGWGLGGKGDVQEYSGTLDHTVAHGGKSSVLVQSIAPNPKEFVSLTQNLSAQEYRGKRIRFTGYLKTENIRQRAKLWMEIYDGDKYLAGDAMNDRAISGTTPWTKYSIVLDVPEQSTGINYGAAFVGDGKLWADDFQIEVVDKAVPTTGPSAGPTHPTNGSFEE
jgi:hypothetical protein